MGWSFFLPVRDLVAKKKRSKREKDSFRDRATVMSDGSKQFGLLPPRERPAAADVLKRVAKRASRSIGEGQ